MNKAKYISPRTEVIRCQLGGEVMGTMTMYTGSPMVVMETVSFGVPMGYSSSDGSW